MSTREQFYLWFGFACGIGLGVFAGFAFWYYPRYRAGMMFARLLDEIDRL